MQTKLNPYIHFKDQSKSAMEFYHSIFGGNLTMTTFKESGLFQDSAEGDNIMHAMLVANNGITLMAADTASQMSYEPGDTVTISLSGDNEEELKGYWDKLSQDAKISVPLDKAPWGDTFGMLHDKFGVEWMVNIAGKKE